MKKPFKQTAKNCPRCGHDKFDIGKGSGPHVASLQCAKCKRFMWWLKKTEFTHMRC